MVGEPLKLGCKNHTDHAHTSLFSPESLVFCLLNRALGPLSVACLCWVRKVIMFNIRSSVLPGGYLMYGQGPQERLADLVAGHQSWMSMGCNVTDVVDPPIICMFDAYLVPDGIVLYL
jgi:hypothetical protein